MIIHITIGIPSNAVTELTGKVFSEPVSCEMISLTSIIRAPIRIVAGTRRLCFAVCRAILAIWGTAIPMNPIGPQKAVMLPARIAVERKTIIRANRIFIPMLRA